jgi:hypothetical protein
MVDCTNYSNKAFLQLLQANPEYCLTIAEAESWELVLKVIVDRLGIICTPEQLEYVKEKEWDKELV